MHKARWKFELIKMESMSNTRQNIRKWINNKEVEELNKMFASKSPTLKSSFPNNLSSHLENSKRKKLRIRECSSKTQCLKSLVLSTEKSAEESQEKIKRKQGQYHLALNKIPILSQQYPKSIELQSLERIISGQRIRNIEVDKRKNKQKMSRYINILSKSNQKHKNMKEKLDKSVNNIIEKEKKERRKKQILSPWEYTEQSLYEL